MATVTFVPNFSTQSVNWNDPTIWSSGVVPNDPSLDVLIPAATVFLTGAPYVSTLAETENYAINSLTISRNNLNIGGTLALSHGGNLSSGIINIGNGSSLTVGDSLVLSANAQIVMGAGSSLTIGDSLNLAPTTELLMSSGSSLHVGSLDSNGVDIQSSGSITSSGLFLNETNLIGTGLSLITASLNNIGTLTGGSGDLTVTVNHGGFANLSGSTLTGGAYVAKDSNKLYLNVGGVVATDAANISLSDGGAIYFFDDTSATYVPITSSLHSISASGNLSLAGGAFNFGELTVDGSIALTTRPPVSGFTFPSGQLVSTGLTVNSGGHITGEGIIDGPIVNFGTIVAGQTSANGGSLRITGTVTGPGTLQIGEAGFNKFGKAAEILELGAAASSDVVFLDHLGVLILDDPSSYTGHITPNSGDSIILNGINANTVTGYNYSGDINGGILSVQTTTGTANLKFSGDFGRGDFALSGGVNALSINITGTAGTPTIHAAPINFNGDGKTDLLWRNDDGNVGTWDMNDHQVLSTFAFGLQPMSWHIAGTGDFNGDGNTDILWRNVDGNVGTWDINDHQILSTFAFGIQPFSWHIAGTGDFDGDGKSDILWRNDDGNVGLWTMNDHQIVSSFAFGQQPTAWHIAGLGDFNGDGKTDILWRNDDGNVGTWDMNGNQVLSTFSFGIVPTAWQIAGTGDFNGDGKSDILWRNADGNVSTWDMNDHEVLSAFAFGIQPAAWHIAGTGDFNGDGKSDILWRNDDGNVGVWDMNDHQILSSFAFGQVTNAWHII